MSPEPRVPSADSAPRLRFSGGRGTPNHGGRTTGHGCAKHPTRVWSRSGATHCQGHVGMQGLAVRSCNLTPEAIEKPGCRWYVLRLCLLRLLRQHPAGLRYRPTTLPSQVATPASCCSSLSPYLYLTLMLLSCGLDAVISGLNSPNLLTARYAWPTDDTSRETTVVSRAATGSGSPMLSPRVRGLPLCRCQGLRFGLRSPS
jgi:hypothetical protein